jgi:hypothetical protein
MTTRPIKKVPNLLLPLHNIIDIILILVPI